MSDVTLPGVHNIIKWARRYMDPKKPFASRLLAFICLKGIHFSGVLLRQCIISAP